MESKRMKFITASDSTVTLAKEVIYFAVKEGIADNECFGLLAFRKIYIRLRIQSGPVYAIVGSL